MASQSLALVTGAAGRLGKAFATALAGEGYAVLVHYWRSRDQAEATARELEALGVPCFLCQADLTSPDAVGQMYRAVDRTALPVRVLVNSASVFRAGDARSLDVHDWDKTLDLNLRAPFLCAQYAAARMNAGGLIVNVTDVGARKNWSRFPAYSVSKAGLEAMTGILARAYAPSIRVNAIAPGLILQSRETPDAEWQRLIERLPLKRAGRTEEIVAAFQFLLENEYVTGQTLVVDGGYALSA